MKNVRIALVGCGGMAAKYRHIYTEIPGAELAALIDASEKTAREAARELNVKKWSTAFEDCLSPDINIIDISTPNHFHRDQAVAALNAGKHIFLQKPMTSNVAEAEEIVKLAEETGKTAGIYMFLFDNPLFYDIKKLIVTGKLGAISGVHCRVAHTGGLAMQQSNWRHSRDKTGGGSFIQLAVHNMNMAQWLINGKIVSVMAYSRNLYCPNVGGDDVTSVACEFDTGALGTISSSYCASKDELYIYGAKGYVGVDDFRHVVLMLSESFTGDVVSYDTPGVRKVTDMPYDSFSLFDSKNPHDQHVAFVKAVQNGEPPPISLNVGLYDMKIVQAVYDSADLKKLVVVGA